MMRLLFDLWVAMVIVALSIAAAKADSKYVLIVEDNGNITPVSEYLYNTEKDCLKELHYLSIDNSQCGEVKQQAGTGKGMSYELPRDE